LLPKGAISMSNSLLYHAFGLRGYDYVKTEYQAGRGDLHPVPAAAHLPLSGLPFPGRSPAGTPGRRFQAVPIGHKPVTVILPIRRVECPRDLISASDAYPVRTSSQLPAGRPGGP